MTHAKTLRALSMGLIFSVGAAGVAAADENAGWYLGASLGQSQFDVDQDELDAEALTIMEENGAIVLSGDSTLDDSDTAWSVFGGYRFSPYFSLEAGYQELGAIAYRSSGTVAFVGFPGSYPASVASDGESSGFTLGTVGSIPIGERFDLHGKLGVLFADTEISAFVAIDDVSGSGSESASSQDLFYGAGFAFRIGDNWSISADYQLFKDVGDKNKTGEEDIDVLTLAVSVRL